MGKTREEKQQYQRDWYQKNRERHVARCLVTNKQMRDRLTDILREAKSIPCTDCGIQYPYYVMQFDHVGDNKVDHVSRMVLQSEKRLREEIAKCEVVCANCHCVRTHQRRMLS